MSLYGYRGMGHMRNENITARLAGLYQNPLAAYSTQQLKEELSRRRKDHVALRLKVKLQRICRCRKMHYRR